ncbi:MULTISPECIES: hypothetical protein [Methanosarcina]|uniref:Uncharacterized protein n=3 Tax=Methanosarcina barkeri TaxID=2208 RepID=A0A0E3QR45_METBA|nr:MULTISPECIES: hypothetical protein [Methanosarcina]AKB53234.1 hypothetical protein MSBRM_0236 [Methanosarcina barkeri MS]AKB58660.1 hypothetical protein MSBR2_2144 [Methanosarcina barkeri 227]AKJ39462.1 hypothetical protein MCM1_2447 [Methanosarcina barkeri CM1]
MKAYNLFLTGFLIITLFIPAFLAEPCNAAFVPSNNITLERGGMTWEYQEQITGNESIVFRSFIDLEAGDSDRFVNAWEILKAESILRDKMEESVKTKPDVKLNGTSEPVKLTDVDFLLSKEALGEIEKTSSITNSATVNYTFDKPIGQEANIWLMGTPTSNVTINLPAGFDVEKTDGLDNESKESENNYTVLKGNFSQEKNITLWISENETYKAEMQERKRIIEQNAENKTNATVNKTRAAGKAVKASKSSGFFKDIFIWFYQVIQKVNLV